MKKCGTIIGITNLKLFKTLYTFDTARELGVNSIRFLPPKGSDITLYKSSIEKLKKVALHTGVMKDFLPLTESIIFRCPAGSSLYIFPDGVRKRCPYEDDPIEDLSRCYFTEPLLPQQILDFDLADEDTRKAVSSYLYALSIDKGMPRCFLDFPIWNIWLEVQNK